MTTDAVIIENLEPYSFCDQQKKVLSEIQGYIFKILEHIEPFKSGERVFYFD